ncbi:hypothetical protein BZG35_11915 [Brevundimonas sp. LM2]|uniref:type II secretion system protein N n=1 Tax=Brevundimonas sp. LM2 TaxID=1938605 RepID=UPI0009838E1B|nr:type II secretion system protein N [Brevundimonas sp. LM2]AQR62270.1 hypothetical protein BZG35_11915 [Brevundimonas sp. LM2]
MSPDRRDEIALRVVSVAVVGSLALVLAGLTWRLTGWDDGRSEVAVAESLPPLGAQAGGPDTEVARIVGLAPFGGGATQVGGLPASSLGLILKGVLMAFPPSASTALISLGEGPATIYGVGQSPTANAVIEAIGIDHVILKVGEARERLDFPTAIVTAPPEGSAAPGAGITVAPVATPLSPQAQAALASASPVSSAAAASAAQPPAPAPSGPAPNVGQTAAAMGATASAQGYRIGANPSAELRRFGLQPGDVIETLNGEAVGNGASDQQLIERARAAGQASVVVVRGGRRLTLNFPLR